VRKVRRALATVDRAIALAPGREPLLAKGRILVQVAAWPQAVEILRQAASTPPRDADGYSLLGWALSNNDDVRPEEVLDAYRRASELAATDPNARCNLGDAWWLLGSDDEAQREYRWVAELPASATTWDTEATRGWCLYRLGRYQEASSVYLRALPGAAEPATLLFDIGLNAVESGNERRGRDAYRNGLAEVARLSPLLAREPLSVAIRDIRDTERRKLDARAAAVLREMESQLAAELSRHPLPDPF